MPGGRRGQYVPGPPGTEILLSWEGLRRVCGVVGYYYLRKRLAKPLTVFPSWLAWLHSLPGLFSRSSIGNLSYESKLPIPHAAAVVRLSGDRFFRIAKLYS